MIRPIVRDERLLKRRSTPAGPADAGCAADLLDTLRAHRAHCVGMAANMIGVHKRIIAVATPMADLVMFNPVITSREEPYEAQESCLSLEGVRRTKRFRRITVEYLDGHFQAHTGRFSGTMAQVIQHECDHLDGILI